MAYSIDKKYNKIDEIMKKSYSTKKANPAQYHLQKNKDTVNQSKLFRKIIFGEKEKNKPHKTVLLVGETGTGKTTLVNVIVNYMLDVQRESKIWFEITEEEEEEDASKNTEDQLIQNQTSIITVYGFYLQESPMDLTIIDTPGYGDTRGLDLDKQISESLLSLSKSAEVVNEIDAVCLVIVAQQNRLSDRQVYILDAIQTLFGIDIVENIVLLFTHSEGKQPRNVLMSVKEAKIKCAVNKQNKPVYFLFDNCQTNSPDEDDDEDEYEQIQEQSWNRSYKGMTGLFNFLDTVNAKSVQMTQDVLKNRKQLEANVSNLKSRIQLTELKQNELKQTQDSLEKNKEHVKANKNFEYEVEVLYKESVDIDRSVAYMAMCCTVCEENCHYPGCWWVSNLSWCSMMRNYHCTVCPNKCRYTKHVKGAKIYVTKTKKEMRVYEDLKKDYDIKIDDGKVLIKKLEEELQELEKEKEKLVSASYECVEKLQLISLKTDSIDTLQHIDFLMEKLKEINEPEKVKTLEDMKKRAGK